jgi:hypothetical protein
VFAKFGVQSYPKAMCRLLGLRHQTSLQEYIKDFEELRYMVSMHNPKIDETFFVEQYIKGLKFDLQGLVQTTLPSSVNRAMILAELQQDHLDRSRFKPGRGTFQSKIIPTLTPSEGSQGGPTSDLVKERQV